MLRAHITLPLTVRLHISKVQRTGDWKYTAHSKPKQTLPSQFTKVHMCNSDESLLRTCRHAHTFTYHFPGVFEELRLSSTCQTWSKHLPLWPMGMMCMYVMVNSAVPVFSRLSSSLVVLPRSTQTKGYVALLFMNQPLLWFWLWENPEDDIKIVAESWWEKSFVGTHGRALIRGH